ncbi:xanthine dehydrogenase-like [Haliotis rubra]|uniref:xanthine dehydrogenase-like n=1 Tax=Haliotis rubra TaxID=36100 RepID=UPI001EE61028|nr:xanthine dehydrogenase-like [Haliotis rubra]
MPGSCRLHHSQKMQSRITSCAKFSRHAFCVTEELFCSGDVKYSGQSLGLVIAESQTLADAAADKVKVTYKDVKPAIVTIEDAIREESYHANPMIDHKTGDPEDALSKASRKLTGECRQGGLYHFYIENNVALAVPAEDRLDVYSSSQGTDIVHAVLSTVLGKPLNYFNVCTPRVGGAFGGKSFGALPVAAAAGLGAYKHNRPVKCNVGLSASMRMNGKDLLCGRSMRWGSTTAAASTSSLSKFTLIVATLQTLPSYITKS